MIFTEGKWISKTGALIASAIIVYLLHLVLEAETIPFVLLLVSWLLVIVDYQRRHAYWAGMALYPLGTIVYVVVEKSQSLFPIVIFYELAALAMIFFGAFLGIRMKDYLGRRIRPIREVRSKDEEV